MEIEVVSGDITTRRVGAIVVNLFKGVKSPRGATAAADRALGRAISRLVEEETTGKRGETTLIHSLDTILPSRVLVVGLGDDSEFGLGRRTARGLSEN